MAKLYTYVDADSNTNLDGLSFIDKILATVFQWFKESGQEAAASDKLDSLVSEDLLTLQADLTHYIDKALEPIKQGKHKSVLLSIDSTFIPVLENLLNSDRYSKVYQVDIKHWPKVDYKRNFNIIIQMAAL